MRTTFSNEDGFFHMLLNGDGFFIVMGWMGKAFSYGLNGNGSFNGLNGDGWVDWGRIFRLAFRMTNQ
jgi:hypothetical protein